LILFIERARVTRRKRLEKRIEVRRIMQKALLSMATLSLVVVVIYLIVLDLTSVEKIDVKALSRSGMISQSNAIIRADSPEERDFALQVYGHLETNFPESISGIEIRPGGLMLLYVRLEQGPLRRSDLRPLARTLTRGFQKRFDLSTCIVLIVNENKTVVEGRFRDDTVTLVD